MLALAIDSHTLRSLGYVSWKNSALASSQSMFLLAMVFIDLQGCPSFILIGRERSLLYSVAQLKAVSRSCRTSTGEKESPKVDAARTISKLLEQ